MRAALSAEGARGWSVGVRLVNDRRLRAINKKYLNHDRATDVIAFGYGGKSGDLAVSTDTARRTARALGISYREELARYLVHGVLHLLGYDDKAPKKRARMHKRQEKILQVILSGEKDLS